MGWLGTNTPRSVRPLVTWRLIRPKTVVCLNSVDAPRKGTLAESPARPRAPGRPKAEVGSLRPESLAVNPSRGTSPTNRLDEACQRTRERTVRPARGRTDRFGTFGPPESEPTVPESDTSPPESGWRPTRIRHFPARGRLLPDSEAGSPVRRRRLPDLETNRGGRSEELPCRPESRPVTPKSDRMSFRRKTKAPAA
jgi:hypothetical protein